MYAEKYSSVKMLKCTKQFKNKNQYSANNRRSIFYSFMFRVVGWTLNSLAANQRIIKLINLITCLATHRIHRFIGSIHPFICLHIRSYLSLPFTYIAYCLTVRFIQARICTTLFLNIYSWTQKIGFVPEFIDPVFTKTSPKRSFSVIQNERFGLVFAKTGSTILGTVLYTTLYYTINYPASFSFILS